MGKYIATDQAVLGYDTFSVIKATIPKSSFFKTVNLNILAGTINIVLSGVTDSSGQNVCPTLTVPITGTSKKVSVKSLPILLEGDQGTATGTFVNNSTGATVELPVTVTIEGAGQTCVKAE